MLTRVVRPNLLRVMASAKRAFSRLPSTVVPSNYAIRLHPDLEKFTFAGKETISVEVKEAVKEIKLNCLDIEISSASYRSQESASVQAKWTYNKDDELVTLSFAESLRPGPGNLSIDFTGELNDKMKGFYRSKYKSPEGEDRFAAVTQFEPTDARRAFPCWDEPAVKATFDVTLVAPKNRVALSNMDVVEEKDCESNLKEVRFSRTPIMSTYLLAFVVGEYDYVEDKTSNGVLVRVYTPVGKKEQGRFALEVTLKSLPFYKDYFGIAYPLSKMDLIAISDFAAGAMENWGLVTYRETCLLIDPENSSSMTKQRVAIVVAHELAHQWFGNLVTMEWWTHLWLNEGFASFMEYLVVDKYFPEYRIWDQFVAQDTARALELDALRSSHPIEVPVGHPSEIDEIFDLISYSKGASVIRMLHNWIGDKAFRTGLNHYLKKFSYKNAFTEDLWNSLEWASDKPVERVMRTWTEKMGFPVLTVSEKKEGNSRILEFSQSKFSADGASSDDSYHWLIPVSLSCASKPEEVCADFLIEEKTKSVKIENVASTDWIKVNPGQFGFYRVKYSSEMLSSLLPGIKSQTLPARDRLGLTSDLFALARAGVSGSVDYLRLVECFGNEEDFNVLSDIGNSLGTFRILLSNIDLDGAFHPFAVRVFEKLGDKLGWDAKEGEGHVDALLRSLVIGKLGYYGHQKTVEEAKERVLDHAKETRVLPADLRVPAYTTSLAHGDEAMFNTLLGVFRKATLQEERMRVARCLGCVRDPSLIEKTLKFSLSDEVRAQDTVFVITSCCGTKSGRELTWKFLQENFPLLHDRYEGGFLLSRLIKETCQHFASEEKAQEIEAFFKANPAPAAERNVLQACENVRLNAAWIKRDGEAIRDWLTKEK